MNAFQGWKSVQDRGGPGLFPPEVVVEVKAHFEPPLTDPIDLERDLDTTIEELRAIRMMIHKIDLQIYDQTATIIQETSR
jgi:hypothetical protein